MAQFFSVCHHLQATHLQLGNFHLLILNIKLYKLEKLRDLPQYFSQRPFSAVT
jgi:hypothetical protein